MASHLLVQQLGLIHLPMLAGVARMLLRLQVRVLRVVESKPLLCQFSRSLEQQLQVHLQPQPTRTRVGGYVTAT